MDYKISILLLAFSTCLLIGSCNSQVKFEGSTQVELSTGEHFDFSAIGEAVKDKRIVALGESSHGIGHYYTFKAELVKYLHEHHGFEILAFEAGLGDLNLAYSGLDSLSSEQLLKQTLFRNFQCEEIKPLFTYIKSVHSSNHPLIYAGFDNQMSSSFFTKTVEPIVAEYKLPLNTNLEDALDGYVRWFRAGYYQDSLKYESEANAFRKVAQEIQSIFRENKKAIQSKYNLSDKDFDFIDQTCEGFVRTVQLPYAQKHLGSGNRDAIMFDNFQWLVDHVYPDKKVILWAHNAHTEQQPMYENSFKWMGHFLDETYNEDYYSLALFAQSGTAYQQWGDTVVTVNNVEADMIESIMMKSGHQTTFLDVSRVDISDTHFSWISNSVGAFENENGGKISFVPKERFDGIVVMREVKAPKY